MDPYQVSHDPTWHRWVDGLVILVIGLAAGLVISQASLLQETTTEVIRTVPTAPQVESGLQTDMPPGVRLEES